ncbi:MAG: hypothetical protein D4R72_06385 [Nitrosopumilales archaeon]|nr:MAG: hypothetical protein D4R72_06385 [Nitrosopumilales archaeon]
MTETVSEKKLWVLVSSLDQNTKEEDLQRITPSVIELVDEWQSAGKFIWSGPFNDNKTGMAVFEATEKEANRFYDKYDKICSGVLSYHLHQWDSLPLLSMLENTA